MELVGYRTSRKEIWDVYQSVYVLWRLPGIPSCGEQIRKRTIRDISLFPKRSHAKAWRGLGASRRVVALDWIDRNHMRKLSGQPTKGHWTLPRHFKAILKDWVWAKETKVRSQTCSWTQSQSHSRSCLRSRSRSCSRACSQSQSQGQFPR